MGKVEELVVTKGKTVKATDKEEWLKVEFSVKASIETNEELQPAKNYLEGLLDGWLASLPSGATSVQIPMEPLDVTQIFPADLAQLLTFEDKGEYVIIKPKAFLGSENFARIADIVKKHNGKYISAGKESHFRVWKTKPK